MTSSHTSSFPKMSDDEMTIDDCKLLLNGIGAVVIRLTVQWPLAVPLEGEAEASKTLASVWDTLLRAFLTNNIVIQGRMMEP